MHKVSITQLVECQIVALEVSGSSPGIYPFCEKLSINHSTIYVYLKLSL